MRWGFMFYVVQVVWASVMGDVVVVAEGWDLGGLVETLWDKLVDR